MAAYVTTVCTLTVLSHRCNSPMPYAHMHSYHHSCWFSNFALITVWMALFFFTLEDTTSMVSKNNLKRGLVGPQHTFPLCCQSISHDLVPIYIHLSVGRKIFHARGRSFSSLGLLISMQLSKYANTSSLWGDSVNLQQNELLVPVQAAFQPSSNTPQSSDTIPLSEPWQWTAYGEGHRQNINGAWPAWATLLLLISHFPNVRL